jgi:hypothetical protein
VEALKNVLSAYHMGLWSYAVCVKCDCMYVCSGVGFPMHCDLYVVYCTSPVNFKSAAITSRRNGTARPTYQRTAEPPPSGGIEDGKCPIILPRGPLRSWGSLTCSISTTRVKRLKVPPGGLVP